MVKQHLIKDEKRRNKRKIWISKWISWNMNIICLYKNLHYFQCKHRQKGQDKRHPCSRKSVTVCRKIVQVWRGGDRCDFTPFVHFLVQLSIFVVLFYRQKPCQKPLHHHHTNQIVISRSLYIIIFIFYTKRRRKILLRDLLYRLDI